MTGLLQVGIAQGKGTSAVYSGLADRLGFSARIVFEGTKPYGMSEEDFEIMRRREEASRNMTEVEKRDAIEEEAANLRELIESGELDIWDDTIEFNDIKSVKCYSDEIAGTIKTKVIPHLRPDSSLFDRLIVKSLEAVDAQDEPAMRGLRAALSIWDYGRMHHEGEPPFQVRFSSQVAEFLDIDPEMESIRAATMRAPSEDDNRRMRAAFRVLEAYDPDLAVELRNALRLSGIGL